MSTIKEISQDLHDTLQDCEHIEKIHFTKEGHHYFNVHEYVERVRAKDGTGYSNRNTGEFYGGLKAEVVEETVTLRGGAIDKKMFIRAKPNPKTKIVCTITRDEALALPIRDEEDEPQFVPQLPQRKRPGRKPKSQIAE